MNKFQIWVLNNFKSEMNFKFEKSSKKPPSKTEENKKWQKNQ
jgi:hypothetical protein